MSISLIAAYSLNRAIGKNNGIPWHYSEDFAHFKRETLGSTLIMGRKTFDSIGRALPGRTTVVLTRQTDWRPEGVTVVHSVDQALDLTGEAELVFGAGGEQIYRSLMPYASRQILTLIPINVEDADAFYPEYDEAEWLETRHLTSEAGLRYSWLERQ